jgi:sialidase-1
MLALTLLFVGGCMLLAKSAFAEIKTVNQPLVAGMEGYAVYRIPGFAAGNDGSLLLFAEGRPSGADPGGAGDIDLVYKRSTDGGQTWSTLTKLHETTGFDYSDPRVVVDRTSGTLHLQYVQWPTNCGQACVPVGLGSNSAVIYYQTSGDNGVTWSGPLNINAQVKDPSWASLNTGPGMGIQLKWQDSAPARNGRLLMPAHRRPPSYRGTALYSDDGGATWTHGGGATPGFADESEVIELTNGDLLWDGRQSGGTMRERYISHDGGETWVEPHDGDITITAVDSALVRYSAKRDGNDRDRILFSGPLGNPVGAGNSRDNIGVWTSYDEGKTFINPVQIQSGSSAYSVLEKLHDGTIGLIYEVNHNTIRFVNFDLAELERASHPISMSHYDGFGNRASALRGGVGWSGAWNNTGASISPGTLEFAGFLTQDDTQHVHFRGDSITRSLGSGALDLNQNRDYYFSLFVNHDFADGVDSGTGEWLDVRLLDGGNQRFAFGVADTEAPFVRNENSASNVVSAADTLQTDKTYLLLAKLAARSGDGGNFDQLFLAWYDDSMQVPTDESQINWQLAGQTNNNFSGQIDEIFIGGGPNADWQVDGLRIGTALDAVIVDTGIEPPAVPGDLNGDLTVDVRDWIEFKANYRLDTSDLSADQKLREGDFDQNGMVDPEDFLRFRVLYEDANGKGPLPAELNQVPERSSLTLFIIGGFAMYQRIQREMTSTKKSDGMYDSR